jgi:hypothetical protein
MATTTATRRLAAILAADVVGYSRLMGADGESACSLPAIIRCHAQSRSVTGDFGPILSRIIRCTPLSTAF